MKYFGRDEQLKLLHDMVDKADMQVALIYGRRRVGKSELIKQVIKTTNVTSIYYECKETTESNNVESLSFLISEIFGYPRLAFAGIEEVLEFLFKQSSEKNLILALDEYPYLKNQVKGMDSILQTVIDKYQHQSRIKLIVCGSFGDVMKGLLSDENPLYGRIDRTIDLKPMDYVESSLFYQEFSHEDKVRLYSVFGGIPYYNRLIDPTLTVRENIIRLIASPGARLENEVTMSLRSEISKLTNANEVFEALANGHMRFSDILSQSHVSSSPTLADVLDKLVRMEVVEKIVPINDEKNKKKTSYLMSDPLSMFSYRYCFRYASQMRVMEPNMFYDRYIHDDFESWYVPHFFEEICRQYLIRQNRRGMAPIPFERIGRYWYDDPHSRTNGEFDLVTEDPDGYVFYEAKFRKNPMTRKMVEDEIAHVTRTGLSCHHYGFFSRSGFATSPQDNWIFKTLSDLYQ